MKKWQKKESKDAKLFKGKRTPRSGGFWSFAGDVVTDNFLLDSKTTDKKGFRITDNIWRKLYNEALKARKIPILSILFTKEEVELVVLDINDFITLMEDKK